MCFTIDSPNPVPPFSRDLARNCAKIARDASLLFVSDALVNDLDILWLSRLVLRPEHRTRGAIFKGIISQVREKLLQRLFSPSTSTASSEALLSSVGQQDGRLTICR